MNFFKVRPNQLLMSATAVAGLSIATLAGAANAVDVDVTAASQSSDATATTDDSTVRATLQKGHWGKAPWTFDTTTGVLTVTGSADAASRYDLGLDVPWNRQNKPANEDEIDSLLIKKIVFNHPEGLNLRSNFGAQKIFG